MSERVVIIDPAFIGDTIFSAPLIRALLAQGAEVGMVVRPPSDQVAATFGVRVHVYDKKRSDRGWAGLNRVASELKVFNYQRALIPHPSPRSALLAWRAQIPRRIGSASNWVARLFLTERVAAPRGFVASRMALIGQGTAPLSLSRRPSAQDRQRVGLVLGSEWATKRWPVERASEIVAGQKLVWLGAEWERPLYEQLPPHDHEDRLGGTLDALRAAIESCDVVIGGDTGPLHWARALGVPVVALFGPTDPLLHDFSPWDVVLTEPLACRPCSAHGQKKCPLGHHQCLRGLSGDRVRQALVQISKQGSL